MFNMMQMQKTLRNLFLLIVIVCLASCSSTKRHDGPPGFYVDESRIPNAVPRKEPLAKYGNMSSYRVFGKRYFTLRSSRHYEEIGTASWYGTLFHARKTSSGEPYDMLGMTAAHKTLPLPTYVEVTNLTNHRKVIVKVNDRGPFESNRLIDLSYVAAKKLGMLGHGTAMVRVKAIDLNTYGKPIHLAHRLDHRWHHLESIRERSSLTKTARSKKPGLYLQVGAFKNRMNAEQLQSKLSSLFDTPVMVVYPNYRNNLYRVKLGPFKDMTSADLATNQLKTMKIKSNRIFDA